MDKYNKAMGYTLIELLIALFVSTILVLGIGGAYTSISGLSAVSQNLQNAQEVLRYSTQTFTRSLKQTPALPVTTASQLTITQEANTIACNGVVQIAAYTEVYSLNGNNLRCEIDLGGAGPQTILTGVEDIAFALNNNLVSITVTPQAQAGEPAGIGPAAPLTIDVALSLIILQSALGS
ncbi:prepilin-type N-terminal cleavage/methylation domain-containing protein [Thalassotalea sp. ND16A]|uniref:prepilin-type N-terminal cleavage/methylation domain-containing protein n=1 Tax=Thalassotalea sp. ND16A TaxID=1535422 RepID=UPI00051A85C2|nr:prepilin-type N-terminal cleavage/methylation domain-containing protein [Thalassotalea sp. ND16A]KGJ88152.1 hypothetical protein ND16A_2705 [Thalassotalea sp. ND16A]